MIKIPECILDDAGLKQLRRHLRIPDGNRLLDGNPEPASEEVSIIEPYEYTHRFRPKANEIGLTVAEIAAQRFPFRSLSDWKKKQFEGIIGINDQSIPETYQVGINDELFHRNIGVVEPTVPSDLRIYAQNEHFMWIDKPAPIPMHSGGRYHRNTVVSLLETIASGPFFIVHRLDAVTSGLVLIAKSEQAAAVAGTWISDSQIQKSYEAIVRGNPPEGEHEISVGIKRDRGFLFKCSDDSDAKPATTLFEVIKQADGWAHVRCAPVTGRTHQIRLHLANWGYPIWDDTMYNGSVSGQSRLSLRQDRAISLVSLGMHRKDQSL